MLARVGYPAPDFEASAFADGGFKNVKLSDSKGKWVALCFYPGDFTLNRLGNVLSAFRLPRKESQPLPSLGLFRRTEKPYPFRLHSFSRGVSRIVS